MTTQTCESIITKSHRLSSRTNWNEGLEDCRRLFRMKFKTDFADILFKSKDRGANIPYFLEIKRDMVQFDRQAFGALWESSQTHEYVLHQIANYPEFLYPAHEAIKTLLEPSAGTKPVEISYINEASVEHLLDYTGRQVLGRIVSLIEELNQDNVWNLEKIEIRYSKDPDVGDWEYILMRLFFPSDFDTADGYLHDLYGKLDELGRELSVEEKDRFQRMFYYDVATSAVSTH